MHCARQTIAAAETVFEKVRLFAGDGDIERMTPIDL